MAWGSEMVKCAKGGRRRRDVQYIACLKVRRVYKSGAKDVLKCCNRMSLAYAGSGTWQAYRP